jgi:hypothetical protein
MRCVVLCENIYTELQSLFSAAAAAGVSASAILLYRCFAALLLLLAAAIRCYCSLLLDQHRQLTSLLPLEVNDHSPTSSSTDDMGNVT